MESYAKKLKWLGKKIKRKKKNESFSLENTFLEVWELYFVTKVTSMNIFGEAGLFSLFVFGRAIDRTTSAAMQ